MAPRTNSLNYPMSGEPKPDLPLEIAHLLLLDIVGYSRLLGNEQVETLDRLQRIVRGGDCFRKAESAGKLIRLPTGDGMALLFFDNPEQPVRCALEIADKLRDDGKIKVRMGLHSGPVNLITDVNDRSNAAGPGINIAQRVMDCGDAGHILLSRRLADDLAHYANWQPYLQDIGACEVKHGVRIDLVNLHKDGLGNPTLPEKLRRRRWGKKAQVIRPVRESPWPRVLVGGALLLAALALVSILMVLREPSPRLPAAVTTGSPALPVSEKSIAVLPFENLDDDPETMRLHEGMHDEILTDLAKVAGLKVISRTSVMQYKTGVRNLREIARQLGVAYVLEGAVRSAGDRVRVSTQLIDARTDTQIWAERYEGKVADIFTLETQLAEKIVNQLKARLSPEEKAAIQEKPTDNLAAYDLYLRATGFIDRWFLDARGTENLFEATRLLDRAVSRDRDFFPAYCLLAHAHDLIYSLGLDHTPERLELAEAAIKSARRIRPGAGEVHLAQAEHFYFGYGNYAAARGELELAQKKLPNNSLPHLWIASIDRRQSRWDEAIQNFERALELDPRNVHILRQLALTYGLRGRFPEMAATLDRALEVDPGNTGIRLERAAVEFDWKADPAPLRTIVEETLKREPSLAAAIADSWIFVALAQRDAGSARRAMEVLPVDGCRDDTLAFPQTWCEAWVARVAGEEDEARRLLEEARREVEAMVTRQPDYPEALGMLGMIDALLGRKKEALVHARRAVELMPVSRDSIVGAQFLRNLALVHAWTGETDAAIEQLAAALRVPTYLSYGHLRLHPYWDSLREDPRFDKMVGALAPQ